MSESGKTRYQVQLNVYTELNMDGLASVLNDVFTEKGLFVSKSVVTELGTGVGVQDPATPVEQYYTLWGFLYDLMRDYLPVGVVERLVQNNEREDGTSFVFTNPHLAEYAKELRERLVERAKKS